MKSPHVLDSHKRFIQKQIPKHLIKYEAKIWLSFNSCRQLFWCSVGISGQIFQFYNMENPPVNITQSDFWTSCSSYLTLKPFPGTLEPQLWHFVCLGHKYGPLPTFWTSQQALVFSKILHNRDNRNPKKDQQPTLCGGCWQ